MRSPVIIIIFRRQWAANGEAADGPPLSGSERRKFFNTAEKGQARMLPQKEASMRRQWAGRRWTPLRWKDLQNDKRNKHAGGLVLLAVGHVLGEGN